MAMTSRWVIFPLRFFEYAAFVMPAAIALLPDEDLPFDDLPFGLNFLILLVLISLGGSRIPVSLRRAARLSGLVALGLAWNPSLLHGAYFGSFVRAALLFWALLGHPLDLMRLWMFGEENLQQSEGLEAHLTDLAMAAGFMALMGIKTIVMIPVLWYIVAAVLPYVIKPPSRRRAIAITVLAVVLDFLAWAPIAALSFQIPPPAGTFLGYVADIALFHIAACLWLVGGSPSRLRHVFWSRESAGPLEVDRGEPHDHSMA